MDTHIDEQPSEEQVSTATATLKLLADPTRLRVVWALLHGEHSVGALAAHLELPAAGLSQHLAKLRLAHLVRTRREGNRIFYLVESDHVRRLLEEALFHAEHMVDGVGPAHHASDVRSPGRVRRA